MKKFDDKAKNSTKPETDLTSDADLEQFNKELNKKILRDLFPVLSSMPLPWIIVAIIVFLLLLFTMIL